MSKIIHLSTYYPKVLASLTNSFLYPFVQFETLEKKHEGFLVNTWTCARCKSCTVPSLLEMGNIYKHFVNRHLNSETLCQKKNPSTTNSKCTLLVALNSLPKQNMDSALVSNISNMISGAKRLLSSRQVKTTCNHLMGQTSPAWKRLD